jgi:hypothetical protein
LQALTGVALRPTGPTGREVVSFVWHRARSTNKQLSKAAGGLARTLISCRLH